jgi:MoxR-like ATPase
VTAKNSRPERERPLRRYLDPDDLTVLDLPALGGLEAAVHVFDRESILAINAALAARRPLLLRGEPGTGKTQLARAAAQALKRAFVYRTVDAATEVRELFYELDIVARLARAQIRGHREEANVQRSDGQGQETPSKPESKAEPDDPLAERNFIHPGVLWWAFHWNSARDQVPWVGGTEPPVAQGCSPENGVVVLLDEIDKADPTVPNGLLEALGSGTFRVPGRPTPVSRDSGPEPLVIVTTNEERSLPDAFLRRCLVLQLEVDDDSPDALKTFLIARARAHAKHFEHPPSEKLLAEAAELLASDRREVRARGLQPPGPAEYLDLVRAVTAQRESEDEQIELLREIARFALAKHPKERDGVR